MGGGYKVSKTIILCHHCPGCGWEEEELKSDDRNSLGARDMDEAALVARYLQRVSPGIAKEFQVRQEIIFSSIL